jgi:hypothetical protein
MLYFPSSFFIPKECMQYPRRSRLGWHNFCNW